MYRRLPYGCRLPAALKRTAGEGPTMFAHGCQIETCPRVTGACRFASEVRAVNNQPEAVGERHRPGAAAVSN